MPAHVPGFKLQVMRNQINGLRDQVMQLQQQQQQPDPYAHEKAVAEVRKKKQRAIMGARESDPHLRGISGAMSGLTDLNQEGVAFKALSLMVIDFLLAIFQVEYRKMQTEFKAAQREGLAYEPDENGVWPTIYEVDGNGKLDYSKPFVGDEKNVPFSMIYMNHYVPAPSVQMAFVAQLADFKRDMRGDKALSQEELILLARCASQSSDKKEEDKNDQQRKGVTAQQMRPQPRR